MEKFPVIENLGKSEGTNTTRPSPNSMPALRLMNGPPPNAQLEAAKKAASRLYHLLQKSNVGREFMAAVVEIFMHYPPDIQMQAVHAIVVKTNSPTLKSIKDTCDEIWEPRRRAEERDQLARARKLALPPPREKRTAEQQARVDAQVAEIRTAHAIPEGGVVKPQQAAPVNHDGNHVNRIWADLEQRKARNALRQEQGNEASDGV